jgi:photosynthetic reaction center cytochrome c subunit
MSLIQFSRGEMPEPVAQTAPQPLPAAADGGPSAAQQYKNVQVLTDVSAAEFMRLQQAMTQWVAPKQGCAFCHEGTDYASDAKPAKLAARLMLKMVRDINANWKQHVQPAGVTCFTCHRGHPVPSEVWFPIPPQPEKPLVAKQDNWREASDTVRKFFPDDSYYEYLLEDTPISVQSSTALPSNTVASQIVAKRVYEMMMTMSGGIGVNCGFCHNSRVFQSWRQSTPERWHGFDGIKLTRALNRTYMLQLSPMIPETRELLHETGLPVLPARETGKQTGNGFVLCATCHYAHPRPLDGANMLQDYPGLSAAQDAGGPHS